MHRLAPQWLALALLFTFTPLVAAQTTAPAPHRMKSTNGTVLATPLNARPLARLALDPKELEGLEVYAADAKALGKVTDVTVKEGRIASIEVQNGGFLGYFATTYEIPADWLVKKADRVELLLDSDVTFQFER